MILLFATHNRDKAREVAALLRDVPGLELRCAADYPELPEVEEDGDTLVANALKKAQTLSKLTDLPTLADDTGLFVEALGGAPGVYSARYAGPDCSYRDNRLKLLAKMQDQADRRAYFATVAALVLPERVVATVEGRVNGLITRRERGEQGFGYDAVFEVSGRTFGEMSDEEKNGLSHRARAMQAILPHIRELAHELQTIDSNKNGGPND